jgi:AraC-like DNA-binding protein
MTDKEISEQVVQYVLTMPDEELAALSVAKLSRMAGVDRFKLTRQFKRQKDMTLECFIFREKMIRAAFLLMVDRMAVGEVSERMGFSTSDYFIRKFRGFYGVVPGKFRELRTQRSGQKDRRSGIGERRDKHDRDGIPDGEDRRKGTKDRRTGVRDRRNWDSDWGRNSNGVPNRGHEPGLEDEEDQE